MSFRFVPSLTVAFALSVGVTGLQAVQAKAPPSQPAVAHADDVPPFLRARGLGGTGDAPLAIAISGLRTGYALVGSGSRVFAVCWIGGKGPYSVTLSDPRGRAAIPREDQIDGDELSVASRPVTFKRGRYHLVVADSTGAEAAGSFTVVDGRSPGAFAQADESEDQNLRRAQALSVGDLAYAYEAFLSAAPAAARQQDSDAARLVARLCHQEPG